MLDKTWFILAATGCRPDFASLLAARGKGQGAPKGTVLSMATRPLPDVRAPSGAPHALK
jgi:hypothetical protein